MMRDFVIDLRDLLQIRRGTRALGALEVDQQEEIDELALVSAERAAGDASRGWTLGHF